MSILESLFSELASQFVPGSIYAPKAPVLSSVEDHQLVGGSTQGFVKLNWTAIVNNEQNTEALVVADGGLQHVETLEAPIVAGTYSVSAATETGSAHVTTLSASAAKGATSFNVVDGSVLTVGNYVVLESSHTDVRKKELVKIDSIATNLIGIGTSKPEGLLIDHASGATVEEVTVTAKTETTDYVVTNATTGEISLLAGQFSAGQYVFMTYTSENGSFESYKIYRNTSDSFATATNVATITSKSTVFSTLTHIGQADEGATFYYWATAIDTVGNESRPAKLENVKCATGVFNTIPTRPLNAKTTTTIDRVTVIWDGTTTGNGNLNGYQIYKKANNSTDFDNTSATVGALQSDVVGGEITYEDYAITTGTTYYYKITAIDSSSTNTSGSTRQGNVLAGQETETIKTI
jgi:hypothetical protein